MYRDILYNYIHRINIHCNFDYGGGKKSEEEEFVFCLDKKINPLVNCKSLIIIITLKSNVRGIFKKLKLILEEMIQWSGEESMNYTSLMYQTGKEISSLDAPSEIVFSTAKKYTPEETMEPITYPAS